MSDKATAIQRHLQMFYYEHPWFVTSAALVMSGMGALLTFVLILEDFLHNDEQHSDGFVFVELLCDFILCTHVSVCSLYYGQRYFVKDRTRLAEPVIAFLCITSLYVYEATARAAEGRVSRGTVFALDFFRDVVRLVRLVVFVRIVRRTARKYRIMVEFAGDAGIDAADVDVDEDVDEGGVQLNDVVPLVPMFKVTTRKVQMYEEIPEDRNVRRIRVTEDRIAPESDSADEDYDVEHDDHHL